MATKYDADFATWASEQAKALAEGRFADLDLQHLTEEVAGMGKSERRELESRVRVLLTHLLKWNYQPLARSRSWYLTVREQREKIQRLFQDSPSLRPALAEVIESEYPHALADAVEETGLDYADFPATCLFSTERLFTMPVLWNRPQA